MQLATVDELADWLDIIITNTSRATLLLETASAQVDRWCNLHEFERTVDDQVDLTGTHSNRLELPGRPVDSVTSVMIDGTTVTDYTHVNGVLWRGTSAWDPNAKTNTGSWGGPDSLVAVTYTHGFAVVPDDVKGVVLEVAARAWNSGAGVAQESVGSYSVTYTREASGVQLLESERDRLSPYRRTAGALSL